MNKVNCLTVCRDSYNTQEEFENAVKKAIMVLLDNDYIMTVRYDANDKELGVVAIEFNYADEAYGCPYPYWLSPDEEESVIYKEEKVKKVEEYESNC